MFSIFIILQSAIMLMITAISVMNIINPKWFWKVFESWRATKEPSPAYFVVRRVFAAFILLIVILLFFTVYFPQFVVPTMPGGLDTYYG